MFTALFSFVILGETLSMTGLAGAAVIVAGVVAATWLEGRRAADADDRLAHAPASGAHAEAASKAVELPQVALPLPERRSLAADRTA